MSNIVHSPQPVRPAHRLCGSQPRTPRPVVNALASWGSLPGHKWGHMLSSCAPERLIHSTTLRRQRSSPVLPFFLSLLLGMLYVSRTLRSSVSFRGFDQPTNFCGRYGTWTAGATSRLFLVFDLLIRGVLRGPIWSCDLTLLRMSSTWPASIGSHHPIQSLVECGHDKDVTRRLMEIPGRRAFKRMLRLVS